jgi:hypothetical protein
MATISQTCNSQYELAVQSLVAGAEIRPRSVLGLELTYTGRFSVLRPVPVLMCFRYLKATRTRGLYGSADCLGSTGSSCSGSTECLQNV